MPREPEGTSWESAAEHLSANTRRAITVACDELIARERGTRPSGIARVSVHGLELVLKRGRRSRLRALPLALGFGATRSDRAARVARALLAAHVPTPPVLAVHRAAGADVLVMEFETGESLAELLADEQRRGSAVTAAARSIAAMHAAGVLHRDLKAANLILRDDASVSILDLDGARVASVTERRRARNLARLAASVEASGGHSVEVVGAYQRARGVEPAADPAFTSAVLAACRAKQKQNARRGRPLA